MNREIITFSSQTYAFSARRCLRANGIRANIIRLTPKQSPRGCTHGAEVYSSDVQRATAFLNAAGISYTDIITLK